MDFTYGLHDDYLDQGGKLGKAVAIRVARIVSYRECRVRSIGLSNLHVCSRLCPRRMNVLLLSCRTVVVLLSYYCRHSLVRMDCRNSCGGMIVVAWHSNDAPRHCAFNKHQAIIPHSYAWPSNGPRAFTTRTVHSNHAILLSAHHHAWLPQF